MKRLIFWISVLVLIAAGILGYNRFMHGNLKIDRELVSEENLNLLADNWEKLNVHEPQPVDDMDWLYLLDKGNHENIYAQLWVNIGDASEPSPFLENTATYSRTGIMDVLEDPASHDGLTSLYKSFNEIFISNSRIAILYWEYEGKANADTFEAWFRDQLELARS